MPELGAAVVIALGRRPDLALERFAGRLAEQNLEQTCILPLMVRWAQAESGGATKGVFEFVLQPPELDEEALPGWLPSGVAQLAPDQREHTRAWARFAFHQQADRLGGFLVEQIPRLYDLDTVARLEECGYSLAAGNRIDVYILADLADLLGCSVFIEMACLFDRVCHRLGLEPQTFGLIFLPDAALSDPAVEAMAYAALKELEHANVAGKWDEKLVTRTLPGVYSPRAWDGPFDAGCYLLDSINESGHMLQEQAQQPEMVAEWLFAMTVGGMARLLRERLNLRYRTARLGGKSRCYGSLGMTVRYVPVQVLSRWAAARLSADLLDRVRTAQPSVEIGKHVSALIERLGLSAEVLRSRFEHQHIPDIGHELAPLRHSLPGQIELRTRQVLQNLREHHLPQIKERLDHAQVTNLEEVRREIEHGLDILFEDLPLGGLNAAREFLRVLRSRITEQQTDVQIRRQHHSAQLKRSLDTVGAAFYALRAARMRLPPWPIALLWILAMVGVPLLSGVKLAQIGGIELGLGIWLWLIGGIAVVLGLWGMHLYRQVRQVNRQHIALVRERFMLESSPIVTKAMQALYRAILEHIELVEKRYAALDGQIQAALYGLRADERRYGQLLAASVRPGIRQAVVDLEQAEQVYRQIIVGRESHRHVQGLEPFDLLALELLVRTGPVSVWPQGEEEKAEQLRAHVLAAVQPVVDEQLARVRAIDLLAQGAVSRDVALGSLVESVQPWWHLKPAALGRFKTQRIQLVCGVLEAQSGDWEVIGGNDPHMLTVLTVHWGVPLLAVSRLDEYRAHYFEMVRHNRHSLLHNTAALALVADPLTPHRRGQLPPATLLVAALALGIARRDADGNYLLPYDAKSWVRLSADASSAVAMMSVNDNLCREVQKRLNGRIAGKGAGAVQAILEEYMTVVPDLEDWQVREILSLERAWGLEREVEAEL